MYLLFMQRMETSHKIMKNVLCSNQSWQRRSSGSDNDGDRRWKRISNGSTLEALTTVDHNNSFIFLASFKQKTDDRSIKRDSKSQTMGDPEKKKLSKKWKHQQMFHQRFDVRGKSYSILATLKKTYLRNHKIYNHILGSTFKFKKSLKRYEMPSFNQTRERRNLSAANLGCAAKNQKHTKAKETILWPRLLTMSRAETGSFVTAFSNLLWEKNSFFIDFLLQVFS